MEMESNAVKRLESLDVLRGFDLFCLTILGPLIHAFNHTGDYVWMAPVMHQFRHVGWAGFAFWDIVMPLFMFMAGVSIPFAFSKYIKSGDSKWIIYRRILRRVVVLWILGAVCQGNLLALDMGSLKIFSNTLQAIAVGYLIASVFFLHFRQKGQLIVAAVFLLLYWILLTFLKIGDYGGGNYTPEGNLAELVDRVVLGRWRDGASINGAGEIVFSSYYYYTWILSSLNFGVTVMTGMFAGQILKGKMTGIKKFKYLLLTGVCMVIAGWLWNFQFPVIKTIWTSSMVLVSSGYCFLLMALFYYLIDYKGYRRGTEWLRIIGMNSIVAYILSVEVGVFDFTCITHSLFFGMEQYIGAEWYHLLLVFSDIVIVYGILYWMYRHRVFLKA